jgi:hypothetical protein
LKASDEKLTMRPKPACRMYLIAWWHMFQCPFRCTETTASKSSSGMFQIMRSRRLPAQLTEDVDLAEFVDALLHHQARLEVVGYRVVVGGSLAAALPDLRDDVVRRPLLGLLPAAPHARIVHDHARALPRQLQCDFPSDSRGRRR